MIIIEIAAIVSLSVDTKYGTGCAILDSRGTVEGRAKMYDVII